MSTLDMQTTPQKVNWRQVGWFLALTFAATWALDLLMYRTAGYGANAGALIALQFQMTLPAFSAILLSLFFFRDSPLYTRTYRERPRFFFYVFLLYSIIYGVVTGLALARPQQAAVYSAITGSLTLLVLIILLALRGISGREAFARAGLKGGRFMDWVLYGAAFVLFYAVSTALNAAFRLGKPVDLNAMMQSLAQGQAGALAQVSPGVFVLIAAIQSILIGSLVGLPLAFGEEYGWRGYLQSALIKIGKRRGILLLGVIWGVWHYPVIWMGHNYPGHPLLGTLLMTIYTVLLAFVLGYVMLKTGSIWLVAFLHALNNQTLGFFNALIYTPADAAWSFGLGVYGLLLLAVIVALLLRDPVWVDRPVPQAEQELLVGGYSKGA